VTLDVGAIPKADSILQLWRAFYNNRRLGGACGAVDVLTGPCGRKLLNPLVAAQNFEYKISNMLDEPLESSLGYLTSLPGALSAYRYRAITGRPLDQYFLADDPVRKKKMNILERFLYLAGERILCLELVAKADEPWTMAYVRSAKTKINTPEKVEDLIAQRRIWINGACAANIYTVVPTS
jgi:chitin synthase